MDPAYLDYLLLATGTFALTTLGFAIAWVRARERAIRAEQAPARLAAHAEARFDRLEEIAESTGLELERLAEGQRFQSKLMAERTGAALAPLSANPPVAPPRSSASPVNANTPH